MNSALLIAALLAIALCVVVVSTWLDRSIDRLHRAHIDAKVAAFSAAIDEYEESQR